MAKLSTNKLLDAFKEMTLIELSEFVKQFENTFGVTAATPIAIAAAAPAAGSPDNVNEKAAKQNSYNVILNAAGNKKINVIKKVRTLTSLGLKETKDLVKAAPKPVLENMAKNVAKKTKKTLKNTGTSVTLK